MAVEPTKTALDAVLDQFDADAAKPLPGAKERHEKLRQFHAYGTEKAKERGLGLDDVTRVVKARIKKPKK